MKNRRIAHTLYQEPEKIFIDARNVSQEREELSVQVGRTPWGTAVPAQGIPACFTWIARKPKGYNREPPHAVSPGPTDFGYANFPGPQISTRRIRRNPEVVLATAQLAPHNQKGIPHGRLIHHGRMGCTTMLKTAKTLFIVTQNPLYRYQTFITRFLPQAFVKGKSGSQHSPATPATPRRAFALPLIFLANFPGEAAF